MSKETLEWLNRNVLIGMTEKRGRAWHYRSSSQGGEPNHYPGFVPAADVRRRLFAWEARSAALQYTIPSTLEEATGIDADGAPVRQVTTDDQVIFRSDSGARLGVFGAGYVIHQHAETLLDGLARILTPEGLAVTADTLGIGSAGLLRGGAQAWVQIETPETVSTPEGVDFRPFICASGSHDGSMSTTFGSGSQLVICDNTLQLSMQETRSRQIKIRHSKHSRLRVTDARHALAILVESADEFARQVADLCAIEVSDREFVTFRNAWAPRPDTAGRARSNADTKRAQLSELYFRDERVSPWKGTGFGVVQAVNTWSHHVQRVSGEQARAARNISRAVTGETARNDAATLRLLATVLDR